MSITRFIREVIDNSAWQATVSINNNPKRTLAAIVGIVGVIGILGIILGLHFGPGLENSGQWLNGHVIQPMGHFMNMNLAGGFKGWHAVVAAATVAGLIGAGSGLAYGLYRSRKASNADTEYAKYLRGENYDQGVTDARTKETEEETEQAVDEEEEDCSSLSKPNLLNRAFNRVRDAIVGRYDDSDSSESESDSD